MARAHSTTRKTRTRRLFALIVVLAMALTACGGNGDGTTDEETAPAETDAETDETPATEGTANEAEVASPTKTDVTVGLTNGTYESQYYVALDQGFFDERGLTVEEVDVIGGGVDITAALASNELNFAVLGMQGVVLSANEGIGLKAVVNNGNGAPMFVAVSSDAASEVGLTADTPFEEAIGLLEGLTIGTGRPGSTTDVQLRAALENAELDPENDVELTALGSGSAMLPAFRQGDVDAFIWLAPEPLIAREEDGAVLIDFRDSPRLQDVAFRAWTAPTTLIDEHPTTVEAFTCALVDAYDFMSSNPDEALAIVQERFSDSDPQSIELGYQVDFEVLPEDLGFTQAGFEGAVMLAEAGGGDPVEVTMDEVVTNEFVEACG